ncbi:MAG: serine/threonine-protein kinase [Pirellulaceae bacterium]|jgi:serine/threonine-protein kinase|nr:serine/threonine-protein kinase [Pirellulaceae bacterium]MDP7017010.1 serine/threonine-protein kinase [Pirellulaceae bacterium]
MLVTHPDAQLAHQSVRCVDNWTLTELIHRGRYAELHRARPATQPAAGPADYVLKQPVTGLAATIGRELLRRESAAAAAVADPHVITVLQFADRHDSTYLVTPFLPGRTVDRLCRVGPLPEAVACWIGRQAAEGLASLHAAGWSHGDVKPLNLLVNSDGHTTLLDLGFASRLGEQRGDIWLGTPRYAAPEVFASAHVAAAADIYSLGCVLYEQLTGAAPFTAENAEELAIAHRERSPRSIDSQRLDVSRDAAALVDRMLSKLPSDRPAAAEVVDQLYRLELDALSAV